MNKPQISRLDASGAYSEVNRVVTSQKGSWRWQDAYRTASYVPAQYARSTRKTGYYWKSIGIGGKYAHTKATAHRWSMGTGSLHGRPAHAVVDDFGDLCFVA